jgi:hypothetical protein
MRRRKLVVVLAVALTLTLSGVVAYRLSIPSLPFEQGITQSSARWSSRSADRVPGIDEGSVTFITLHAGPAEGVPFVVWCDQPYDVSGGGGGAAQGASYVGQFSGADGRRVEFRAKTADGRSGSVTIAGVDYGLAKGSLCLVSTRDHPPKVVQVPFDLSVFPSGGSALQELARATPQIRGFFEQCKKNGAKPK